MTKQNNQLVQIHHNLERLLSDKAKAMPKNFNQTRFIQNAMSVIQDTKGIEKVTPISAARTLLKGAFLGLDFFQRECYAIPYGDKLQFQTDYKGEIKLIKQYSLKPVSSVYAKLVRSGDLFEESVVDGRPTINFKPRPFSKEKIIGVFAVCIFSDGAMEYETMTAEEIENIRRRYSKMPDGMAWKDAWGEMAKKTCLRRLTKMVQIEFESREQAEAYDDGQDAEFIDEPDYGEPIEMPKVLPEAEEDEIVMGPEDSESVGGFATWSELDDAQLEDALSDAKSLYNAKKDSAAEEGCDNWTSVLKKFKIPKFTPKDMTPAQYHKLINWLMELS